MVAKTIDEVEDEDEEDEKKNDLVLATGQDARVRVVVARVPGRKTALVALHVALVGALAGQGLVLLGHEPVVVVGYALGEVKHQVHTSIVRVDLGRGREGGGSGSDGSRARRHTAQLLAALVVTDHDFREELLVAGIVKDQLATLIQKGESQALAVVRSLQTRSGALRTGTVAVHLVGAATAR